MRQVPLSPESPIVLVLHRAIYHKGDIKVGEQTLPPRKEWPRIPVPPGLFNAFILIAQAKQYDERTLWKLLYLAMKHGFPNDWERLSIYFDLVNLDLPPDP